MSEATQHPTRVRHDDSDNEIKRNRIGRWLVLLLTLISLTIFPAFLGGFLFKLFFPFIPNSLWLGHIVGFGVGGAAFAIILPEWFIVSVTQIQAFVTLNPLLSFFHIPGNPNVTYGPGHNISYPWEQRSSKGNVPLDILTIQWEEDLPGLDTQLKVKGSYQFKPDITMASRFIGVDSSTIFGGAIDLIKSRVSARLATMSADNAKASIENLNKELGAYFGIESGTQAQDHPSPEVSNFENNYGVHTVKVTISGIDLPESVQKTRDAIDEARQVLTGVAAIYAMSADELADALKNEKISLQQYHNMVDRFFAKSENATMEIKAYKFDGLEEAAHAFAAAAFTGGTRKNVP